MSEETTSGVDPDRLARLLELTVSEAGATPADALADLLGCALPLDGAGCGPVPAALAHPSAMLLGSDGRAVGQLLVASHTPLAILRGLKMWAKQIRRARPADARQAAATVLYFAAVAAALVRPEHAKITRLDYDRLAESFAAIEVKDWVPADLAALFRRAATVCRQATAEPRTTPEGPS